MYRVLIVEDDPMIANINKMFIEKYNDLYIHGVVENEKEVLEVLKTTEINLILLDIYLKNSNGVEILKKIRKKGILADVIFITAANTTTTIKEAMAYGIVDFLIKPYTQNRLDDAINKFLKKNEILTNLTIDQSDYDKHYSKNLINEETPKGISRHTLEKIEGFLCENKKKIWNVKKMSDKLNISKVTLNKYLKYLLEIKRISVKTTYGEIGRPEKVYKYIL